MISKWDYIGDGVYVGFDGYHIVLRADDAEGYQTNVVYLDVHVALQLIDYIREIFCSDEQ